jgi:hypothetical protein
LNGCPEASSIGGILFQLNFQPVQEQPSPECVVSLSGPIRSLVFHRSGYG